jgi:chaperonin cofactor prefoldin
MGKDKIALGIICVILAVGLVGAVANYTSIISGKDNTIASKGSQISDLQTCLDGNKTLLNSQISSLSSEIATLQSQKNQLQAWLNGNITSYETQISSLNAQINQLQTWLNGNVTHYTSQINSLNSQIASLQSQISNLTDIVNLAKSTIWVDSQTISQPASSYTYWTVSASYAGYVSVWVQTSTTTNTYVRVIYTAYGVNYDNQIGVGASGTAVFPLLPCSSIEIRVGNTNLISGATETVTITYHY